MFKSGVCAVALVLFVSGASAQAPPMDMSWGIQNQMQYQYMGDQRARAAALAYYNYMRALRARGYRGPSLPTGVTGRSLQNSINGANRATQGYIRHSQAGSNARSNAVDDYDMRAIRGCYYYRNQWGHLTYACR